MKNEKNKSPSPETIYGLIKDGNLKKGFSKSLKIDGINRNEVNMAESLIFKIAQQVNQETFCNFMKNKTLDNMTIKLTSQELSHLKGGFWGLWGHILTGACDWGISWGSNGGQEDIGKKMI